MVIFTVPKWLIRSNGADLPFFQWGQIIRRPKRPDALGTNVKKTP
jgi:hypothetical protein